MTESLYDRQKSYEETFDLKLIKRLPIIIRIDGRNFSRLTRSINKPYCSKLAQAMAHAMLYVASEIDGAIFGYQQTDEFSIVLINDQNNCWLQNKIQAMASLASSMATLSFNRYVDSIDYDFDLIGDALFDATVFPVPSITEAINNMVSRQNNCAGKAISAASFVELGIRIGKSEAYHALQGKTPKEKREILLHECGVDFNAYPGPFKLGVAAYKAPRVIETEGGTVTKNKWVLDAQLPVFTDDPDFLNTIFRSGRDVFRIDRDLEK